MVAMRPLGFLGWSDDGWNGVVGWVGGGVMGSTVVSSVDSVVDSFVFSFGVGAPAGAMGFFVPVLSWSMCYLV